MNKTRIFFTIVIGAIVMLLVFFTLGGEGTVFLVIQLFAATVFLIVGYGVILKLMDKVSE